MTMSQSFHDTSASASRRGEQLLQRAHGAVDQLHAGLNSAATSLSAQAENVKAMQTRMTGQARGYVREHPLATVAVALGAGLLLARLIRR